MNDQDLEKFLAEFMCKTVSADMEIESGIIYIKPKGKRHLIIWSPLNDGGQMIECLDAWKLFSHQGKRDWIIHAKTNHLFYVTLKEQGEIVANTSSDDKNHAIGLAIHEAVKGCGDE